MLQFEVVQARLEAEYNVPTRLERLPYQEARLWYEHRFDRRWSAYLRASARFFEGGTSDALRSTEERIVEPDVGGGLGGTYLGKRQSARLDLYWQEGYGGRTLGAYGHASRCVPLESRR